MGSISFPNGICMLGNAASSVLNSNSGCTDSFSATITVTLEALIIHKRNHLFLFKKSMFKTYIMFTRVYIIRKRNVSSCHSDFICTRIGCLVGLLVGYLADWLVVN